MERPLAELEAGVVRDVIARLYLGSETATHCIGTITLRPHQCAAVDRLRQIIGEFGGALLADEVGLGKTYVAAAIARTAASPLIVAPAALRAMWGSALNAADARADFVSYEGLSRRRVPNGAYDLLVLDEAHHVRTPRTVRYRQVAELARGARVLLLSATPIHNARRDLAALLALFLGESAWSLDDAGIARYIVRRERQDIADSADMPQVGAPQWLHVGRDEALLRQILALPPPLPPSDGGDGGVLGVFSLVRQWASSHGALAAALRRRLARAGALIAALERGRYPSRAELAAWSFSEDALQLAFPELMAPSSPDAAPLLSTVRDHERALRALLRTVSNSSAIDEARANRLRELRAAHPSEKIIAFTQYRDTVTALFSHLRRDGGVAALSARTAAVAGGALSRAEAIRRFAPVAMGVAPPRAADRVDLLLATDLLSEGVNLQDASVVVHLELPWTPARLEQRVGRSRRLGALHARTAVYALAPPAEAESLLRIETRLREKLRTAERLVGVCGVPLAPPVGGTSGADPSPPRRIQLLRNALTAWKRDTNIPREPLDQRILVAAVRSPQSGLLAVLREGERHVLLGGSADTLTDDPPRLLDLVRLADGPTAPNAGEAVSIALAAVMRWIAERRAALAAGGALPTACVARREALYRIAAIMARAPRHHRPLLAPLVIAARQAATAPYGVGAERALGELVAASLPDDAWLRVLADFAAAEAQQAGPAAPAPPIELRALLVLTPD